MSENEIPSYVYVEFLDQIQDRISFGENHPERKVLNAAIEKVCQERNYESTTLHDVAIEIMETIVSAKEAPDEIFDYLGLENVESNTGQAFFVLKRGKEVLARSKCFHQGNLLFSGLRPYLNKAHLVQIEQGIGSEEFFVLIPKKDQIMPEYLLEYLISSLTLAQTRWILTGCSYPRLDKDDFGNLKIIRPSMTEQKRIIEKISAVRDSVNILRESETSLLNGLLSYIPSRLKVEKPKDNHYDVYRFWLGETTSDRLDFTWNNPWLIKVEELLDSLNAVPLGKYLEPKIESGVGKSGGEIGAVPLLNIQQLGHDGRIHKENLTFVNNVPKGKLLRDGDLLISRTRDAGICALVSEKEKGYTFSQNVLRFRLRDDVPCLSSEYVTVFLNSWIGQAQIDKSESGSAGKNINTKKVPKLRILIPNQTDLSIITEEIRQVWQEMDRLDLDFQTKIEAVPKYLENYWQMSNTRA